MLLCSHDYLMLKVELNHFKISITVALQIFLVALLWVRGTMGQITENSAKEAAFFFLTLY